ncbi:DNA polymerase lambda-like isoform X2 [Glandiceps talaboti]
MSSKGIGQELSRKRGRSELISGRQKKAKTADSACKQTETTVFLQGVKVYILQAGLGKARANIFMKQLTKFGGVVHDKIQDDTTHVIVDEQMVLSRMCRILKLETPPSGVKIVKANWLSTCLAEKTVIKTTDYELDDDIFTNIKGKEDETPEKEIYQSINKVELDETSKAAAAKTIKITDAVLPSTSGTSQGGSDGEKTDIKKSEMTYKPVVFSHGYDSEDSSYEPSDDEEFANRLSDVSCTTSATSSATSTPNTSPQKLPKGNWVCAKAVTDRKVNHNKHITDKLEILMKTYKNTKDQWRALGYSKAIMALKNHHKEVTSWEEANNMPGIGRKLADKVWEIIQSGHLRKIDYVCQGEDVATINLFTKIWGVGPTIAQEWYQRGFRTLEDAREKAKLTKQQKIGMKYFDDLLDRMSREEAAEIEKIVKDMALSINPGLIAMACGSYRRGKPTCGDVDVLVTHPDGKSHKGIFQKLLDGLRAMGFLTDDLVSSEDAGEQKKYLGVCKLPGENRRHRRLDIIVVPYHEYPCAIMYFTGSSHFNRSMRALAGKK